MTEDRKPRLFEEAEQRLIEYGSFCRHPVTLRTGVRSIFARVVEMKENAAIFGSGAPTEQFMLDGEMITVRSDGGLGALVASQHSDLRAAIRAKEVHDAIQELRAEQQEIVRVTWVDLPPGKEAQTVRAAAEQLSLTVAEYRQRRLYVLAILDAKLVVPRFLPATEKLEKVA